MGSTIHRTVASLPHASSFTFADIAFQRTTQQQDAQPFVADTVSSENKTDMKSGKYSARKFL